MLGYAYLASLDNANPTYKKLFIINGFVIKTIKLSCVDTDALKDWQSFSTAKFMLNYLTISRNDIALILLACPAEPNAS